MYDIEETKRKRAALRAATRALEQECRKLQQHKRRRTTTPATAATLSLQDRQLVLCTFWLVG